MIFNQRQNGPIDCVDWCDLVEDEVHIALIDKSKEDGYWRAEITYSKPLSCGHLKRLADKVSELNKALDNNGG